MKLDLVTSLKALRMEDSGEVFWLSTEPEIEDEDLDFRTSCL